MNTLFITYGIPSSGKDRWATEYIKAHPNTKRVNKDLLREMLDLTHHSQFNENFVLDVRDWLVRKILSSGVDCIVSDTNFPIRGKHFMRLCKIAEQIGDITVIEKFFHIAVPDALIANKGPNRRPVPDDVIHNMFDKYIKGKNPTDLIGKGVHYFPPISQKLGRQTIAKQDETLDKAIICDLDGTLCLAERDFFNPTEEEVFADNPNPAVVAALEAIMNQSWDGEWGYSVDPKITIIFCSGRFEKYRAVTEKWLRKYTDNSFHNAYGIKLFMRPDGDSRPDNIVKGEIYENNIKGKYNVLFCLDDRDKVVEFWRYEAGLPCFQVAEGAF